MKAVTASATGAPGFLEITGMTMNDRLRPQRRQVSAGLATAATAALTVGPGGVQAERRFPPASTFKIAKA